MNKPTNQPWQGGKCRICPNKINKKGRIFCSLDCYRKSLRGVKGKNAPRWKDVVGKGAVHKWLNVTYGKPKICQMKGCKGKSIVYDWSLNSGCKYEKKRKNFRRLCRSCHHRYDMTPETRDKAIKNLIWNRENGMKLNRAKVEDIRKRVKKGENMTHIANEYGVAQPTIKKIRDKQIWKKI